MHFINQRFKEEPRSLRGHVVALEKKCSVRQTLLFVPKSVQNTQTACIHNVRVKVKQSRYRPGVAQRVPGS